MAIGIVPTVDYAFKKLLGSPDHSAITLHFLNAVLAHDRVIQSVEFLNPFLEKEFEEDKLAILDVRAKDDQGRWLNIEMQTSVPGELPQRLAYYAANQYVGQMKEGDAYESLTPPLGSVFLMASGSRMCHRFISISGCEAKIRRFCCATRSDSPSRLAPVHPTGR